MEDATLNRTGAHKPTPTAYYAEYYEEENFKQLWRRLKDYFVGNYKNFTDRRAAQAEHKDRVRNQLLDVGLHKLDLIKPETYYIASIVGKKENIKAAICGHMDDSSTALIVITDARIIYLNQIPLFTTIDEMGYGIIQGVSIEIGQFDATIRLNTTIKEFVVHKVGIESASKFVAAAEKIAFFNAKPASIQI